MNTALVLLFLVLAVPLAVLGGGESISAATPVLGAPLTDLMRVPVVGEVGV